MHAERLHRRASDLSQRGFEWTLRHGEPRNTHATTYPLTPPCCRLKMIGNKAKCLEPDYIK